RFDNLILSVIDVLEPVEQQVIHCLDILGEQSHDAALRERSFIFLNAKLRRWFRACETGHPHLTWHCWVAICLAALEAAIAARCVMPCRGRVFCYVPAFGLAGDACVMEIF